MKPTEILMHEHRVIEQVLTCLERMAERGLGDGRVDAAAASDALSFFRTFADRCHHGKEENQLFPLMETRGFSSQGGPTAVMRLEHEQGRELLRRLERAIPAAAEGHREALDEFAAAARSYVRLLRAHIEKEDHCLFPMADQALGPADHQALLQRFEQVEHEEIGSGVHEECLRTADRLARRYDVTSVTANSPGCCGGHGAA